MQDDKIAVYQARFAKVFDYIHEHLDEPLSLERLSRVANFSKFHFHRQFSLYAGISATRYIQLMRLRRASYRLAFECETRIIQIALEAGFESPESFSRAFKQAFGQTPTQFREDAAWQPWNQQFQFPIPTRTTNMDVKIIDFPETRVAALEHLGHPDRVNETAGRFIQWRKESGLSPVNTSKSFGLAYDDPAAVEPADFRFAVCGTVKAPVPTNPQGVIDKVIPAGRCAVVRHYGSHARISDGAYFLYREWLPQSGEELRDFPLFFHYLNLMPDTPEHELVTDIHLPLQG